jgi:hypothetical protein
MALMTFFPAGIWAMMFCETKNINNNIVILFIGF